ncbi:MAG TPA: YfhO family protein [Thermoanaerobaculia bacterium]|nr:YfhO family protein [Thermoanaerobaculia bacterium]
MSLNPVLPLLVALALAGLLAGLAAGPAGGLRRELGVAWAALGIAGIALLLPALALPDGIPSPAAALAQQAPWRSAFPSAPGNPVLRDVTFQIQPWLLHTRRELRAGRLPLWNPHQFSGAPFWSNGQAAPLFPLHLLFAVLPLQFGFILLPWLRLVVGGCGVWALARELGLSPPAALIAALVFPLSGMLVSFLLFPMASALALVPWVFWSVERLAAGRPPWLALPLAAGLQLLAGHPETAAFTALLSALYLAVRGVAKPLAPLGAWLRFAGGWLLAGALAAVELVPLARTLPETARWQSGTGGSEPPFALLLQQPLRLVLPELYGHPAHGTWWGPFNYSATAVYAGALALPLAAAGLARLREPLADTSRGRLGLDRRWLALLAVAAFSFAAAYHWPGVRDLLAAVPVLGRAAPHRLLFAVELALALLAGAGCDAWLAGRGRGALAGAAAVLALLAAAWLELRGAWAAHATLVTQACWTAAAVTAALAAAAALRVPPSRRGSLYPLLPALVLGDLLCAHGGINPGLPLPRLYPSTGAIRFLAQQPERVAGIGEALRPNAALVYGLYDPRGDDPVKLARYERVYGAFAAGDPVYFQPIARWRDPWLDRLAVRWVVAGPAQAPAEPDWKLAYQGGDARIYERPSALPMVRWIAAQSAAALAVARREPGRWQIDWQATGPGLLVIAESWERGWRARGDGRELPVEAAGGALLGVRLGPGGGRLDLRYRPPGLAAGALLSLLGMLGCGGLMVARRGGRGD